MKLPQQRLWRVKDNNNTSITIASFYSQKYSICSKKWSVRGWRSIIFLITLNYNYNQFLYSLCRCKYGAKHRAHFCYSYDKLTPNVRWPHNRTISCGARGSKKSQRTHVSCKSSLYMIKSLVETSQYLNDTFSYCYVYIPIFNNILVSLCYL